ncbi:hypothetical protein K466DRAFT_570811, partial [Polyporus arcularius HHB13444]
MSGEHCVLQKPRYADAPDLLDTASAERVLARPFTTILPRCCGYLCPPISSTQSTLNRAPRTAAEPSQICTFPSHLDDPRLRHSMMVFDGARVNLGKPKMQTSPSGQIPRLSRYVSTTRHNRCAAISTIRGLQDLQAEDIEHPAGVDTPYTTHMSSPSYGPSTASREQPTRTPASMGYAGAHLATRVLGKGHAHARDRAEPHRPPPFALSPEQGTSQQKSQTMIIIFEAQDDGHWQTCVSNGANVASLPKYPSNTVVTDDLGSIPHSSASLTLLFRAPAAIPVPLQSSAAFPPALPGCTVAPSQAIPPHSLLAPPHARVPQCSTLTPYVSEQPVLHGGGGGYALM